MKKLFISMLAVAALASCSKEEAVRVDRGEAITFGNAFVDNATRATDGTYGATALTAFDVYGTVAGTGDGVVNIFSGAPVTGTVGSAVWSCDVSQYWIKDATYNFAAVVDAIVAQTDTTKPGMPTTLTTVTDNTMNFKDMLYAQKLGYVGKADENEKVNFVFEHLLAKAFFTVTSNTEGGYYYSVKDINVANYESGVYTIGYAVDENGKDTGSWTVGNDKNVAFGAIEKVTKADADGKTNANQMLLVPTTTDFKVTCTIEIWNDNGDAEDVLLGKQSGEFTVSQDLLKGHVYNFGINLEVGEKIEFTVTSNPAWAPEPDVTL